MIVNQGERETNTKQYEVAAPDTYLGRCIRIVDLGTHTMPFTSKKTGKPVVWRKVEFVFELDEYMKDGKPFVVSIEFPAELWEGSKLDDFLTTWRNRPFTEEERKGFDLKNVLNAPGCIAIIQTPSKDGKRMFNVISSVTKVLKGAVVPDAKNELLTFDIEEINTEKFEKLWFLQQKKVKESHEGKRFFEGNTPGQQQQNEQQQGYEEIPF